jgi:hypothetical protein
MRLLYILPLMLLFAGCASTPPPIERPLPKIVEEEKPITPTERWPDERYIWAKQKQYVPSAPPAPDLATKLVIDINSQSWHHFEHGNLMNSGVVSTGSSGTSTPRGHFRAGIKQRYKRSSLYPKPRGGAPMNYAIQVRGDIFLHEGYLPGYPASHGCIRVWTSDAKYLWRNIRRGDKIVVI